MTNTKDVYHVTGEKVAESIQNNQESLFGFTRTNMARWSPILTNNPGYALQWASYRNENEDKFAILKYTIPEENLINYGSQPSLFRNQCYGTNLFVQPNDLTDSYLDRIKFSRKQAIELSTTGDDYFGKIAFYQILYEWFKEVEIINLAQTKVISIRTQS